MALFGPLTTAGAMVRTREGEFKKPSYGTAARGSFFPGSPAGFFYKLINIRVFIVRNSQG
jgi:hypothetical protein